MRQTFGFARISAAWIVGLAAWLIAALIILEVDALAAQPLDVLPSPLDGPTVVRLARERRAEVQAARFRASAASERPNIVSALPDPMVMVSVDQLPFSLAGIDGSISVQQEFPLSGVLGARRRAAEADARRWEADEQRAELDVEVEALGVFYMLCERRGTGAILEEQIAILNQVVMIARAHLAAGQGMQADVLRLDNERARLQAERGALDAEIRGSEATLNTTLARPTDAPVPPLAWEDETSPPPAAALLAARATVGRPELAAARADRARALAEVEAMRSMYTPMALVRVGPSYTMAAKGGVMAMVGVTIPLWRGKLASGVAEARAMASMSEADIDAMQRMIRGRVASAREVLVAEQTRLLALRNDILPRARLVVETATQSFGAGQGLMLGVLDAARDLREVRMEELVARARLGAAWAALRRETGELGGTARK